MKRSLLGWYCGVTGRGTLAGRADHGGPEGLGCVLGKPWKGFPGENDDNSEHCLDATLVPGTLPGILQGLSHLILTKASGIVPHTMVPDLQWRKHRTLVLVLDLEVKGSRERSLDLQTGDLGTSPS